MVGHRRPWTSLLEDSSSPADAGLVLRWPGTSPPGFPGFISDVAVAPLT